MRKIVIAALALTACAPHTSPADADGLAAVDNMVDNAGAPPAEPAADVLTQCDGSKANALLGRVVDAAVQAEAKRLVGAGMIRVIPPGAAVTMDYRGDRLNIDTDAASKAVRFHCS